MDYYKSKKINNYDLAIEQIAKVTDLLKASEYDFGELIYCGENIGGFKDAEQLNAFLSYFAKYYTRYSNQCPFRILVTMPINVANGRFTSCQSIEYVCQHCKSPKNSSCKPEKWDFCPFNPAFKPDYIREMEAVAQP